MQEHHVIICCPALLRRRLGLLHFRTMRHVADIAISASNYVIPVSDTVDLDVTVTTEDVDVNSQILQYTVTDQLDILGTDAINSLQLMIRNNPVKVRMDKIYTHYPEPLTSPGIMSTDQQKVPRPMKAWAWMPNSLLDNHDTQHADHSNNLLSIPFSDNEEKKELCI